jgi:hypothetical protein
VYAQRRKKNMATGNWDDSFYNFNVFPLFQDFDGPLFEEQYLIFDEEPLSLNLLPIIKKKRKKRKRNPEKVVIRIERNDFEPKSKRRRKTTGGIWVEIAEEVLRIHKRPMNRKEMYEYIVNHNMIKTTAKKPKNILSSKMYQDMKWNEKSIFVKVKCGLFGLKEWYVQ